MKQSEQHYSQEEVNELSQLALNVSGGLRLLSVGPVVFLFAVSVPLRTLYLSRHYAR